MRGIIEAQAAPNSDEPRRPLAIRLAWFFGLAAAGVVATAAAALLLRGLLLL
jgi:hypothetical protein